MLLVAQLKRRNELMMMMMMMMTMMMMMPTFIAHDFINFINLNAQCIEGGGGCVDGWVGGSAGGGGGGVREK